MPQLTASSDAPAPATGAPDVDPALREYLREWRRAAAKEQGVPAFVVMHDSALDEVCRRVSAAGGSPSEIVHFWAFAREGITADDFFLTDDGPVINEINTMPGFTTISMYPRMWAASGVDYPTLLSTMVETAVARGVGLR